MKTYGDNSHGISLATFDRAEIHPSSSVSALLSIRNGNSTMQFYAGGPSEVHKMRRDLEAIMAGLIESFWPEEVEGYIAPTDDDTAELAEDRKAEHDCWSAEANNA